MIKHCVTFRFVEGTSDEAISAFAEGLAGLPAQIDVLKSYSFGRDLGLRDDNADFAVVAEFEDPDGVDIYATHPAHVAVIENLGKAIVAARTAVQFEC
jgi:hypothetical protein